MFNDSLAVLPSGVSTPVPSQQAAVGSTLKNGLLGVAMANASAAGAPVGAGKPARAVAGSKALDALVKLINTCESFFHPSVRRLLSHARDPRRPGGLKLIVSFC